MSMNKRLKLQGSRFSLPKIGMLCLVLAFSNLGCGGGGSTSTAGFTRYAFPANRIATDHLHNQVWGTFGSSSPYPNTVVEIDASTGRIGTPIPVGSEPDAIGLSADGKVAYVGLDGSSKVRKVDLQTRTAGATISYSSIENDPNMVPDKISVNPVNSGDFAIGVVSTQGGFKRGPYYFHNGVVLNPPADPIDGCESIGWINSTDFIRMQSGGSGLFTRYGVTPSAVSILQTVYTHFTFTGNFHFTNANSVITDDGRIFSTSDFTLIGTIGFGQGLLSVDTDPNRNMAWGSMGGTSPATIRAYELSNFTPTAELVVDMNGENYGQFMRLGTNGLVISSRDAIYVMKTAPGI